MITPPGSGRHDDIFYSDEEKIKICPVFELVEQLIESALDKVSVDGLYLTYAINAGRTINMIVPSFVRPDFYPFDSIRPDSQNWRAREGLMLAFLSIDCGLFYECLNILTVLDDKISAGSVFLFSNFFYKAQTIQNERLAWQEFSTSKGLTFCYIGRALSDGHVALQVVARHVQDPDK